MRTLGLVALSWLLPIHAAEGWQVQRLVEPLFPPLAQQARIRDKVTVRCEIAAEGVTKECAPVSGHPLLAQAVVRNAKQWTFRRGGSTSTEEANFFEIEYNFEFSEKTVRFSPTPTYFSFKFPNRVTLTSAIPSVGQGFCSEEEWQALQKEQGKKGKRKKRIAIY
ncbi:MAG: energy transducer TonB [Acidobacteria bacterium]|nr:energy transducer TonB [Acidobacteriota bacterium]